MCGEQQEKHDGLCPMLAILEMNCITQYVRGATREARRPLSDAGDTGTELYHTICVGSNKRSTTADKGKDGETKMKGGVWRGGVGGFIYLFIY